MIDERGKFKQPQSLHLLQALAPTVIQIRRLTLRVTQHHHQIQQPLISTCKLQIT